MHARGKAAPPGPGVRELIRPYTVLLRSAHPMDAPKAALSGTTSVCHTSTCNASKFGWRSLRVAGEHTIAFVIHY
jgi:hypothetical protein